MLNGKLVLVTGASRGIGNAIALILGRAGATVIGTATSEEGADNISKIFSETKQRPNTIIRKKYEACDE